MTVLAAIDIDDLIEYAVPILLASGWILSRVAALIRGLAGRPARPPANPPDLLRERARRQPPRPEFARGPGDARPRPAMPAAPRAEPAGANPPGAPGAGRPVDPREDLARQIEEFLSGRRPATPPPAAPRTTATPRPAPGGQPAAGRAPRPAGAASPEGKPGARKPTPGAGGRASRVPIARPATGAATPIGGLSTRHTDVARHVEESFGQGERAPLSGATPAAVAPLPAAPAPTPAAAELVAALRDPATLRRMILVREVLDRPVDRW